MQRFWNIFILAISAGFLTACGGSSNSGPANGTLSIALTDGPADDAMEVHVFISGITVKREGVDPVDIVFPDTLDVDLLTLTGDNTTMLLNNEPMVAGQYQWIALNVDGELDGDLMGSYVIDGDGGRIELEVPSGVQSGLRLVTGFAITVGQNTSFVIDWDVRQGLTIPQGREEWLLRPAFRITDMTLFGTLNGMVDETLLMDASCTNDLSTDTGSAIYVFQGLDVTPDDIDMTDPNPFATAAVTQDPNGNGDYSYEVNFLDPGDYTVALTCQSEDDLVDTSEDIVFVTPMNATIVDDQVTTVPF